MGRTQNDKARELPPIVPGETWKAYALRVGVPVTTLRRWRAQGMKPAVEKDVAVVRLGVLERQLGTALSIVETRLAQAEIVLQGKVTHMGKVDEEVRRLEALKEQKQAEMRQAVEELHRKLDEIRENRIEADKVRKDIQDLTELRNGVRRPARSGIEELNKVWAKESGVDFWRMLDHIGFRRVRFLKRQKPGNQAIP